jgi:uncharacterized membrane protein
LELRFPLILLPSHDKNNRGQGQSQVRNSPTTNPAHTLDASARQLNLDGTESQVRIQATGIIPMPIIAKQYNEISPGLGTQIIQQGIEQSKHRMTLEKSVVRSNGWRAWAGLMIGGVVAIFGLERAYEAVMAGHEVFGTIVGTVDLTALVSVFVIGRKQQGDERIKKSSLMAEALKNLVKPVETGASDSEESEDQS